MYSEGSLWLWQLLNGPVKKTDKALVKCFEVRPTWTEEGAEGGSLPLLSDLALCDNHDDFDSQPISKKKVPKIWFLHTHTHQNSCHLRLLCKTRGRAERARPLSQSNLTYAESSECLKPIFNCQSMWKWLVGLFHATVKIVCSPNSLRSLKKKGFELTNACPCMCFLDHLHYKTQSGRSLFNQYGLEEEEKKPPTEAW